MRLADSHSARNDELFRPVQIEYKVKDANFIVLTDSVGNEPEGEAAKFYVLKKVKNMRLIKNVDSNFATHVFISRDILLDYLFKNSKQSIHYRHKTNNISLKIINIVYCKTRWEITPVFVCDI